jgi:hypothetical protein
MNFGLSFASQKIPGISFNLAALNNNHEPESAADALAKYSAIILPERNVDATVKRLTPLINDPSLQQKVTEAAGKTSATIDNNQNMTGEEPMAEMKEGRRKNKMMNEDKLAKQQLRMGSSGKEMAMPSVAGNNSMLAQVVGIILGSPEFQKR